MIQILAGEKGEGKTKRLIDMANEAGKLSDGHIVFIDDDSRHMYDLHYNIRFVDTTGFIMEDQRIFFGFICGILSQDRDIDKIYIDGLNNIIKYLKSGTRTEITDVINRKAKILKDRTDGLTVK